MQQVAILAIAHVRKRRLFIEQLPRRLDIEPLDRVEDARLRHRDCDHTIRFMEKQVRSGVFHLGDAQAQIPGPPEAHTVDVLRRGTARVLLSMPVAPNRQTPHEQDEVYVIVGGRGVLFHDGKRDPFETGDLLFVSAGVEHHFEDFSDDLAVWVVFSGAEGGEVPA